MNSTEESIKKMTNTSEEILKGQMLRKKVKNEEY